MDSQVKSHLALLHADESGGPAIESVLILAIGLVVLLALVAGAKWAIDHVSERVDEMRSAWAG